jgi:hypothetical protein
LQTLVQRPGNVALLPPAEMARLLVPLVAATHTPDAGTPACGP